MPYFDMAPDIRQPGKTGKTAPWRNWQTHIELSPSAIGRTWGGSMIDCLKNSSLSMDKRIGSSPKRKENPDNAGSNPAGATNLK